MQVIVCGIDGSDQSLRALDWAVDEAGRSSATLKVVHGWLEPLVTGYPFAAGLIIEYGAISEAAQKILDDAMRRVASRDPEVKAEGILAHATAVTALLEEAKDADLVVVGSRGRGGFSGLLLGSVSQQLVHHAACPVVVVPAQKS